MKYSHQSKSSASQQISKDIKTIRSTATKLFVGVLMLFATLNFCAILYLQFRPHSRIETSTSGFLQACRELCARYGLIETGNLAADAQAYLEAARQEAEQNMNKSSATSPKNQTPGDIHPLLGKAAPNFDLPNEKGDLVHFSELNKQGPTVVVFYYGYFCSHCVAQLFAINEELSEFSKAGGTVVALSPDNPEHTTEMFKQYGRFDFPVVADEERSAAIAYECYRKKTASSDEDMLHGTFVVDHQGMVRWAYTGYTPFIDNKSLLQVIRDLEQNPIPVDRLTVTRTEQHSSGTQQ